MEAKPFGTDFEREVGATVGVHGTNDHSTSNCRCDNGRDANYPRASDEHHVASAF